MKYKIITLLISIAFITGACSSKNTLPEIYPLKDTPTQGTMSAKLFSDAPDSLITALGLQDGILISGSRGRADIHCGDLRGNTAQ